MMAQRSYNEGNYAMAKRLLDSISISYRHEVRESGCSHSGLSSPALVTAMLPLQSIHCPAR